MAKTIFDVHTLADIDLLMTDGNSGIQVLGTLFANTIDVKGYLSISVADDKGFVFRFDKQPKVSIVINEYIGNSDTMMDVLLADLKSTALKVRMLKLLGKWSPNGQVNFVHNNTA